MIFMICFLKILILKNKSADDKKVAKTYSLDFSGLYIIEA